MAGDIKSNSLFFVLELVDFVPFIDLGKNYFRDHCTGIGGSHVENRHLAAHSVPLMGLGLIHRLGQNRQELGSFTAQRVE